MTDTFCFVIACSPAFHPPCIKYPIAQRLGLHEPYNHIIQTIVVFLTQILRVPMAGYYLSDDYIAMPLRHIQSNIDVTDPGPMSLRPYLKEIYAIP